ncbi:MAG: hypothetical protein HWN81_14020 [Candidatus Lokiarchaeota archaeon]|nr:hypothetical protein [Candidatus Lokiarchaeota archaeon]
MVNSNKVQDNKKLIENVDYYLIDDKVVFTEKFLKSRGKCCNNTCKHCPYKSK